MRSLKLIVVAGVVGVLVLGFVFASIPYSETIRWLVSVPVWVLGTAAILLAAQWIESLPSKLRALTCFALSGWIVACVAVAVLASYVHALDLLVKHHVQTPQYWIWCRAILGGMCLAIIPLLVVFRFARRDIRINDLTHGST